MTKSSLPYKLSVMENLDSADILLYGIIGEDWWMDMEDQNTDQNFAHTFSELRAKYKKINIRINSPGGSVYHGNAIVTCIQDAEAAGIEVHTYNDGIAASMAADIWMSCKNRHMAKNALLMVHPPSVYACGNAIELRETAEMLDKFESVAIGIMATATGMSTDEIKTNYYDGSDHWLNFDDCQALSLITDTTDYQAAAVPPNVQQMSLRQLMKQFEDQEQASHNSGNLLSKVTALFRSLSKMAPELPSPNPITKSIKEMKKEDLQKSIAAGELTKEEALEVINGLQAKSEPPAPTTDDATKTAIDLLSKSVKDLSDQVAAMKGTPGDTITKTADPGSDDFNADENSDLAKLQQMNKTIAEANNTRGSRFS